MSVLGVKTRGDSSPQGKARVYFSCHPLDFELYFETICEDVFSSQNCAIYYANESEGPVSEEELSESLSEMQLFVIPVSTRYLLEDNRAVSYEYSFAMEHHIPVLPITMESNLYRLFSAKMNSMGEGYGSVQYLNRCSTDSSEIPYDRKLKIFLESVLIGDETAQRIRTAFDAYIFMSYRKKDRFEAKKLMRLIHQIPFCRDIAIWYDEYLVPGESWRDAIKNALEKSQMVAMAVTPNLIEPNNYIINDEYPQAMKMKKNVVPIELTPTDHELLNKFFSGISLPIDANNKEDLILALSDIATRQSETSPEHNFLIGLAYLMGLDVEIDLERGLQLVRDAANSGLVEAISKLEKMYKFGEGVAIDYYEAIEWQERIVSIFEENDKKYEDRNLLSSILELSDLYKWVGNSKRAGELLKYAFWVAKESNSVKNTLLNQEDIALCLVLLGNLYLEEELFDDARRCFEEALSVREHLYNATKTLESLEALPICYGQLGYCYEKCNDYQTAKLLFKKGRDISEELVEKNPTIQLRHNLSGFYNDLGQICLKQGELAAAKELFEFDYKITKQLVDETSFATEYRNLSICLQCFGDVCEKEGNKKGAIEYYIQASDITRLLADKSKTSTAYREHYNFLRRLGELSLEINDYEYASQSFEEALNIMNVLSQMTQEIDDYAECASLYNYLTAIYILLEDYENAHDYSNRGYELAKMIAETTESERAYHDLWDNLCTSGNIFLKEKDYINACERLDEAVFIMEQLLANTGYEQFYNELKENYEMLIAICNAEGNSNKTLEYIAKLSDLVSAYEDEE